MMELQSVKFWFWLYITLRSNTKIDEVIAANILSNLDKKILHLYVRVFIQSQFMELMGYSPL